MPKNFVKIENSKEWQDLLGKVLFKTFFHYMEWEEFLENNFKPLKFERYNWKNQALLSIARVKVFGRETLISHPFCEYGGPMPLVEKINGREFQKDLFGEFKNHFKISFHPKLLDYFEGIDFPENQRETYFLENLDSKTEEDLWRSMDRNRHRSIKEAKSHGFSADISNNPDELKSLHNFYGENLEKYKVMPYPFSFFEFLSKSKNAKVMMLHRRDQKLLFGGNIFLRYHNIFHSFLCGFDKISKIQEAHSFILWEAIREAKREGCSTFDFGATRKGSSIGDFKERWGAKSYPVYELKNYSDRFNLRKVIRFLIPKILIKKISPKYKL